MKNTKIGIIGFGTVGAGVAQNLLSHSDVIARRTGIRPVLSRIADIDLESDRGVDVPREILTNDARALIDEVDIVAELVGGTGVAKDYILEALDKGKPVVTANKALLAEAGKELFAAAEKSSANIYYEASVAGGIPIIKSLREGFAGNRIQKILGILNGTCNYILTRMEKEGVDFHSVLGEAQRNGYAEADPSLDIDGLDTAHKAAILASLAYGEWFGMAPVYVEGIRSISLLDIKYASDLGYKIKLLAVIRQDDGDVQIRVHPALVPENSLLAEISGVYNGVVVEGDTVGKTLFCGRGAGREATSSAVIADIVDASLDLEYGSHRRVPAFRTGRQFNELVPMPRITSRYYMRLKVSDRPGVIAAISAVLGKKGISISSIVQKEDRDLESVPLVILTDNAVEASVTDAVGEIQRLDCVSGRIQMIRIEDE